VGTVYVGVASDAGARSIRLALSGDRDGIRRQTVVVAVRALAAELTSVPGASAVVLGGAVVYATELKRTLLGVDAGLLAAEGPVHPEVARQLAVGVRDRLAVAGRPADIGVATTGVAGPDPQGGRPVGTVYVGVASDAGARSVALALTGERDGIRRQTVVEAVRALADELGITGV
jgi:nicotinamide-nucleotide amidase